MNRAQIIGVGAYRTEADPDQRELEKMVETSDEWIVQRTGIRERHIVDEGEGPSDLAIRAAQQAMERAQVTAEEIDFIVVGTTAGDMHFPTTANLVQHRLGCRNAGSVDVYAACSGSVYSLSIGAQYVQTGKYRTVLCIGAECLSRITDFTDRGTCILLADAAGAAVLRPSDRRRRHHRHRSLLGRPLRRPPDPARGRLAAPGHPRDGGPAACTSPR